MKLTILNHKAISWNKIYNQGHWRNRHKLATDIHYLVSMSLLGVEAEPIKERVDIILTASYKDKRRHDPDNLASKLYIDGLKHLLKDDDSKSIRCVVCEVKIGQPEDKLEIEIIKVDK